MPLAHLVKLTDSLELDAVEGEELRIAVLLTHCPEEVRNIVRDLRAENARLRAAQAKRRRD